MQSHSFAPAKEVSRDAPKKLSGLPLLGEKEKRTEQYCLNSRFLYAALTGNLEEGRKLLSMGASVNAKNSSGITALMDCTLAGHMEFAKFLLENGIDKNARDMDGHTARAYVFCGHIEMRQFLIKHGVES
jgi:ankyrin repeat protein